MRLITFSALAALLALSACSNPYNSDQQIAAGAASGESAGATTGALVGGASTPVPPPPAR